MDLAVNGTPNVDRTVALVPIKLNNERLPGKNLKPMADGVPMMGHLLRTLQQVGSLDEVVVYCSDPSIERLVTSYGARLVLRDPRLDLPTASSNDILGAFMRDVPADVYVLAHATSPFLQPETVETGLLAIASGAYDSALTVLRMQDFVWIDDRPVNYDPAAIPRTQDLQPFYVETSAYFAFRREVFAESGRRVGDRPKLVTVSEIEAIDIDNPIDFDIANALLTAGLVSGESPEART